jgi:hypothetical protein
VVFFIAIIKPAEFLVVIYQRYALPLLKFALQTTLSFLDYKYLLRLIRSHYTNHLPAVTATGDHYTAQ